MRRMTRCKRRSPRCRPLILEVIRRFFLGRIHDRFGIRPDGRRERRAERSHQLRAADTRIFRFLPAAHPAPAEKGEGAQGDARAAEKKRRSADVGGIYGKVVALTDSIVTLEVAPNVRVRVNRPQISEIVTGDKAKDAKES